MYMVPPRSTHLHFDCEFTAFPLFCDNQILVMAGPEEEGTLGLCDGGRGRFERAEDRAADTAGEEAQGSAEAEAEAMASQATGQAGQRNLNEENGRAPAASFFLLFPKQKSLNCL